MKRLFVFVLLVFLSLFFTGCKNTTITSTKDPDYLNDVLTRIYVKATRDTWIVEDTLTDYLLQNFSKKTKVICVDYHNSPEIKEGDKITRLLSINIKSEQKGTAYSERVDRIGDQTYLISSTKETPVYIIEAYIKDLTNNRTTWRANVTLAGSYVVTARKDLYKIFARDFVKRLIKEGIAPPK